MASAEDGRDTTQRAVSSDPTPPSFTPRSPAEDRDEASKPSNGDEDHDQLVVPLVLQRAVPSHPTPRSLPPRSPSSEDRDEASKLSNGGEDHHQLAVHFVLQPESPASLPWSPLYSQPETPWVSSVGEEETATRTSHPPSSTFMSPLSVGLQESGQTSAVAVTTTGTGAGASTTAGPSSPLDQVLIIGHGRFQRIVLACTTLAFFATIVHALASTNLARPVDHWCSPPAEYAFVPEDTWRNLSIPVERDGSATRRSQCHRYEPPFEHPAGDPDDVVTPPENRSVVPCDAGWHYENGASSAYRLHHGDFGFEREHSIVVEWDLVCDRGWIVSALTAAYMAGGVVGAPVAGIAADRIGRRPVLCIWFLLLISSGTMLVFAHNLPVFAALRFVLSAGASGVLVASHVLLFEVTDTEHRVSYCAIAVAGATFAAAMYAELVYVYIRNWHAAQVAYMAPTCGLIVTVYLMEESPCWLLAVSDMCYAEDVLAWAAGVNQIEPGLFKHRLSLLKVELNRQREQLGVQPEPEGAIVSDHEVRVTDLLSNQAMRQRSVVVLGCWFLVFGTFSHLTTARTMRANEAARTVLVLLRLPCVAADVYVLKRAGRCLSLASSMFALSLVHVALSAVIVFGGNDKLAAALVVSGLLVFDLSAITVFAFSAELYPTVLRGAALGCCYMSGRLGAFVAPFVDEMRSPPLRGAAYAASAAMLLLLSAMAFALPETRQLAPSNTVQGMMAMEDKWLLYSPLRVARSGGKHRRSRTPSQERTQSRSRTPSSVRQLSVYKPATFRCET
ncbi:solute carrier family 22 member 12-like [Dermacentor albipictus]|uniref:solute carrier family 22 member 12-like n=1 Tax=Dermacentor albipictus TaxID=60249 RepID=UPI0038FC6A3D